MTTTATQAAAGGEIHETHILFETGVSAQVLYGVPDVVGSKPPLLFLHGSMHAAWCWNEHFLPFFLGKGFPVVAYSWRGTTGTWAGRGVDEVRASDHVKDLNCLMKELPSLLGLERKPNVICHSFGGIMFMKFLETIPDIKEQFSGIIMAASTPPSGFGKSTNRLMKRSLRDLWKLIRGFMMKQAASDPTLCRQLFFGAAASSKDNFGVSSEDVARYQERFAKDGAVTVDVNELNKQLPSKRADQVTGHAPFVSHLPPVLVLAAEHDILVDHEANVETAIYFGLTAEDVVVVDAPHDIMLGRWEVSADVIENWLLFKASL